MRLSRIEPSAWIVSVAAHCLVAGLGAWFWSGRAQQADQAAPRDVAVEIEPFEPTGSGSAEQGGELAPQTRPVPPGQPESGPAHAARPDVGQPGRGGTRQGEAATNLSSSIDPLTLERDPLSHLRESEVQRLRTARLRRSWDDRRATPHPMELTFVASGKGRTSLRRPIAASDPSPGNLVPRPAQPVGSTAGVPLPAGVGPPSGAEAGSEPMPRLGIPLPSQREQQRASANIVLARPWVPATRAAVPAARRDLPSDTDDSRQRVASRVTSLLQASTLGGATEPGAGGEPARNPAAAGGGLGSGSRSQPSGSGNGSLDGATDPELQTFYRSVLSTLNSALRESFPRWAVVAGRGGLVVFDLSLRASGQVESVSVVRPSGIDEYDRNVTVAVRQIRNFRQTPKSLGDGLVLRIAWDSRNPVVGRDGPGPGHVAD